MLLCNKCYVIYCYFIFDSVYESDGVELENTDEDVKQEYKEKNSKRKLSNLVCILFKGNY